MARAWVQAVRRRVRETKSVDYSRYILGEEDFPADHIWASDLSQVVLPAEAAPEPVKTMEESKFFNVVLSLSVDEAAVINRALVSLAYSIKPQEMTARLEATLEVTPLQNELAKALNKARAAEAELEGEN